LTDLTLKLQWSDGRIPSMNQGVIMANPHLVDITSDNWDKEVKYATVPVMVDFYSPT
jgi:hypothetical protein